MDPYRKCERTGICMRDKNPLPGRRVEAGTALSKIFKAGSVTPSICRVSISYDQFMNCMQRGLYKNLPYVLHFKIYDEAVVSTREECMLRYQFLKYIHNIPGAVYDFYLSDSALPAYISFMNSMNWMKSDGTTFHMSLDRHPTSYKRIPLEHAKGKLDIPEEKLLWFSDHTLRLLPGKVDSTVLSDTEKLKRFIQNFMSKLDSKYRISGLSEFDKAYLTFHYLFDTPTIHNIELNPLHITYATEQTYIDEMGIQRLKPSSTQWESKPVGTLEHRKGVCTGQARLFNSVLNSPEIKIPAESIFGDIPSGEHHCWSNFVIDNHIFQCCTTIRGIFANLDLFGYKPDFGQDFTNLYPHAYLPYEEIQKVKKRVNQLKK